MDCARGQLTIDARLSQDSVHALFSTFSSYARLLAAPAGSRRA